ncbi:Bug family tripartite tricarboxylate transporter substrate binding protein [Variovorax sp. PBL-E5]|uniref:Bug family tripartite tricarboxylate transporter substrate binding protein n=1 Tax=Variovorax sp. PBL-E5 TaxID=434014 RepID=UPI001317A12D|nr:tripartite tricarboxylate transporter substrate binding protein [Variovorax sp. PBL-E5]VTU21543.1 Argininosuccinate lyase [Variovorax sp. PBL-E5]
MTPHPRRIFLTQLMASGASLAASPGFAQTPDYPSRSLRIVVPFAPGGGGDVLGRLFAQKLSESMKQPVIVENKPGASSVIASDFVAKSAPDGYTLLLNVPLLVQTMSLYSKLPYDALADLTPVTDLATSPQWLAVSTAKVKATTFKAYVEEARRNPQDYNYASIGPGSSGHLLGYALNEANGLGMTHVPYKGSAPAMMALMSGEIAAVFLDFVTLKPQLAVGKVRLLAVTGSQRSPLTPDVPTLAELGYPGFEAAAWAALFVPARTPPEVMARLESEIRKVLAQPDVQARVRELGYEPGGMPHAQFVAQVRTDAARWGALIKKAGVKLD